MIPFDLRMMEGQVRVAARLLPESNLTFRAMFGGIMGYANRRAFVSLSHVGLALKLPPEAQEELLRIPDARRLQYSPKEPVSKQYIVVPMIYLNKPKQLRLWVERSIKFALTLPVPKRKTHKSRR
jgi:TfoX/Sxy family transcriptional regulator of competence genes